MKSVTPEVYTANFDKLFSTFRTVHSGDWSYAVVDLPGTELKMIELFDQTSNKVYFRVILKATYDDVTEIKVYPRNYKEINWLTQTQTNRLPLHAHFGTATQVFIAQLNHENNIINDVLFTYASTDEFIKIEKHQD